MKSILNHQLYRLITAHLKEIVREPAVLFWGIVFPILMAWGLGIAFTTKSDMKREVAFVSVAKDTTGLYAQTNAVFGAGFTPVRDTFSVGLKNAKLGNVSLLFRRCSSDEALVLLKKGTVSLIIEGDGKNMTYHFDPANAEAQLLYQLVKGVELNGRDFYSAHQEEIKPLDVKGTRYIDFLVPGLLAMGIMMSSSWGISYTIIERRSKKLLRRMVATPMKKSNLLLALIVARFAMNVLESLLLFLFAWLFFGVAVQGSLVALLALFLAGNMAFAGISVLISSRTANPEIGNGLINAVVTPMMVVSGVFFSYHHFPEWIVPVIQYMPLTLLADGVRSVFNEGAALMEVWKAVAILSSTGVVTFFIGLKIFRWY